MSNLFASPREAGGGGPCGAWWRGLCRGASGSEPSLLVNAAYPSTTLGVVPFPASFARRGAKGPPFSRRNTD
jgi:hypothetical protein